MDSLLQMDPAILQQVFASSMQHIRHENEELKTQLALKDTQLKDLEASLQSVANNSITTKLKARILKDLATELADLY